MKNACSDSAAIERRLVETALTEADNSGFRRSLEELVAAKVPGRGRCLRSLLDGTPRLVFTKHYNMGGSHYAYTEGQSDAQRERHFSRFGSLPAGDGWCLREVHRVAR